jgi:hypothetical protein
MTVAAYDGDADQDITSLPAPGDEEAALSPRPFYAASPAATAALTVAKSLSQAIELWQMTEEAPVPASVPA